MRKVRLTSTQKACLSVLYRNGGSAMLYGGRRTYNEFREGNRLAAVMNGGTAETLQILGLISNADGNPGVTRGGEYRLTKPGLLAHQQGWHDGRAGNGPNREPRWMWDGPELWEGM